MSKSILYCTVNSLLDNSFRTPSAAHVELVFLARTANYLFIHFSMILCCPSILHADGGCWILEYARARPYWHEYSYFIISIRFPYKKRDSPCCDGHRRTVLSTPFWPHCLLPYCRLYLPRPVRPNPATQGLRSSNFKDSLQHSMGVPMNGMILPWAVVFWMAIGKGRHSQSAARQAGTDVLQVHHQWKKYQKNWAPIKK